MSTNNQYVPFATGANANTLTPAAFAGSPEVQSGFEAGTASSAKMNTALRQTSVVTTAITQFVADTLAVNVVDDGNVGALEGLFEQALTKYANAPSPASLVHGGPDNGGANALSIAASPVISALRPYMLLVTFPSQSSVTATSGSPATIVTTGSALPITTALLRADGSPIQAGDFFANRATIFMCDGTNWRLTGLSLFDLASVGIRQGTPTAGTSYAYTTTLTPGVNSSLSNFYFSCQITTTNTTAGSTPVTTIDFGLGPKPIVDNFNVTKNTAAGRIPGGTGFQCMFFYDGANVHKIGLTPADVNSLIATAIAGTAPVTTTVGTLSVYTAAATGIPSGTTVVLPFTGQSTAFGSWSNGTFTCSVAGNYALDGYVPSSLSFPTNEGFYTILSIVQNGNVTVSVDQDQGYGAYSSGSNLKMGGLVSLNVGDTLQVTFVAGGAPYNVGCQTNGGRLTILKEL